MKPNPRIPLTFRPIEPVGEKSTRVPKPPPEKTNIKRPPSECSNVSSEQVVEKYLKMDV